MSAITSRHIMNLVVDVTRSHDNIKVCVKESLKGGLIAGTMTVIGGVLLGPAGLAVGGALGGLTAAATTKNYRPLGEIILNDLTDADRAILVNRVRDVVTNFGIVDAVALGGILLSNSQLEAEVLNVITKFMTTDLHYMLTQ